MAGMTVAWLAVALALAGWLCTAWLWWQQRTQAQRATAKLGAMERQISAINDAGVGMGRKILSLQRSLQVEQKSAPVAPAINAGAQAAALMERDIGQTPRPAAEERLLSLVRGQHGTAR